MQIYNPYAIEIKYPVYQTITYSAAVCTDLEIEKLWCTFSLNAMDNETVMYKLMVECQHLRGDDSVTVRTVRIFNIKVKCLKNCFHYIDIFQILGSYTICMQETFFE